MKDKQIGSSSAEPRIPLLSAALHCVSMTVLVYLRSSFGFGFLRPKSVFLAFSWAFALYALYAWIDGAAWRAHRALLCFGGGAVLLYGLHLFGAFRREWNQRGEHEHYSGASRLALLLRRFDQSPDQEFGERLHLWVEPVAVLLASLICWLLFGAGQLALWLGFAAVCLWSKEALNHWFRIRGQKRLRDSFDDTEETVEPVSQNQAGQEPPKAVRKAKVKRSRNADEDTDAGRESAEMRRWSEVLRLLPPFSLEQAEANYRELIKLEHLNAHENSEASNARTAELNEAMEFFRERLSR